MAARSIFGKRSPFPRRNLVSPLVPKPIIRSIPTVWEATNADWIIDATGLAATRVADATFWGTLRSTNALATGRFSATCNVLAYAALFSQVGIDCGPGSETSYLGTDGSDIGKSVGYASTGTLYSDSGVIATLPGWGVGDKIEFEKDDGVRPGSKLTIYLNGTQVYSTNEMAVDFYGQVTGTIIPMNGPVYAAVADGNGTGTKFTADFGRFGGFATFWTRPWLPSDLAAGKLGAWLKGNDLTGSNGSSLTGWTDANGGANSATVPGAAPTLVVGGLNGMNTVAFAAASSQYLALPSTLLSGRTGASGMAAFAVVKRTLDPPTDPTSAGALGDFGGSGIAQHEPYTDGTYYSDFGSTVRQAITGVPASTGFRIVGHRAKTDAWNLDVDATNYAAISGTGSNTFATNSGPTIGRSSNSVPAFYFLDGQIAEIVDCADFLTTAEKEKVEGYLAWKWGLQANLPIGHTYKTAPPFVSISSNGTVYSVTIAASVAVFGSEAQRTAFVRTVLASISILPNVARTASLNRTISDKVVTSSSVAKTAAHPKIVTGSIALFSSTARGFIAARSITGSIVSFASARAVAAFQRTIIGSTAILGSVGRTAAFNRTIAGTVVTFGRVTTAAGYVRSVTGRIVVAGLSVASKAFVRLISGSIATSASLATSKAFNRSISTAVAIFASTSRTLTSNRTVAGLIAVPGSVGRQLAALRTIAGAVTISSSVAASKAFLRTISGAVRLSASVDAAAAARAVLIAASVRIGGQVQQTTAYKRTISGLLAVQGSFARTASLARSITGTVVTAASVATAKTINVTAITGRVAVQAAIAALRHGFAIFGPIIRLVREVLPFPPAAREDGKTRF